jgi:pimeloyl-ACP methyl ester carboxylesterase
MLSLFDIPAIIHSRAFPKVPSSYDRTLKHLESVNRIDDTHIIPVRYVQKGDDLPTILMCHGNGEDIGHSDPLDISNKFNINVCTFDYAGYGLHSCKDPSEDGCYQDVKSVYNYLIQNKGIKPNKLIIYGRSLGTAAACHLSYHLCLHTKTPPLGLILVSPMMSAVRVMVNMDIPGDKFVNCLLAPKITCPTLIVHSDNDTIIPYRCGVELSLLFPNLSKLVTLIGRGHNDIYCEEYQREIQLFIDSLSSKKI